MYKKDLLEWLEKEIKECTKEYQNAIQVSDDKKVDREGDKMVILLEVKQQAESLIELPPCVAQ